MWCPCNFPRWNRFAPTSSLDCSIRFHNSCVSSRVSWVSDPWVVHQICRGAWPSSFRLPFISNGHDESSTNGFTASPDCKCPCAYYMHQAPRSLTKSKCSAQMLCQSESSPGPSNCLTTTVSIFRQILHTLKCADLTICAGVVRLSNIARNFASLSTTTSGSSKDKLAFRSDLITFEFCIW